MLPPSVPPDDAGNPHTVTFAAEWLPVLLGLLHDAMLPAFWLGTPDEREQASEWADEFIKLLMVGDE